MCWNEIIKFNAISDCCQLNYIHLLMPVYVVWSCHRLIPRILYFILLLNKFEAFGFFTSVHSVYSILHFIYEIFGGIFLCYYMFS